MIYDRVIYVIQLLTRIFSWLLFGLMYSNYIKLVEKIILIEIHLNKLCLWVNEMMLKLRK